VTAPSPVIAQQYPSTAFLYSRFHFRKGKFAALLKNVIILLFVVSLNCAILKIPNLVLPKLGRRSARREVLFLFFYIRSNLIF
jgi:hypothetical protein